MLTPQPLRPQAPSTFVQGVSRLLLAVVLISLALWPAPTGAEQGEEPVQIAQAESAETLPAADEAGAAIEEEAQPEPAPAGAAIAPPPDVEVIRIKGRAVTAIETDVPESVTQFDAAAIEALGAQNISDLAKVTPNVEIRVAGATAATFFVRGVGLSDFNANAAGAVAIYQDDVAKNAPAIQLGQLFDVENVEVLRGPQGGGSGRNASAGAIKAYSRKPTGETTAQLRASVGSYASPDAINALIQDYEGALEVPLVEEMLATRLAFRFRLADPFMTNGCGDAPPDEDRVRAGYNAGPPVSWVPIAQASVCGERNITPANFSNPDRGLSPIEEGLPTRVGDQGNWAARGQLRLQPPGTDMDWLLNLHGSRLDQQSTLGQAIGTGNDGSKFGSKTGSGIHYTEPDQGEEHCRLQGGVYTPVLNECDVPPAERLMTSDEAFEVLGKNLAEERPLDIRPYRGDYNRVGQTTLDTWGASLRGDFSLGPVSLTSISGYDAYERFRDTDQDFTPELLFEAVQEDEAWQLSQELRLFGELEDTPLRWEAGGYYLMEKLKADVLQDTTVRGDPRIFGREYQQDLWSFAFYGGFVWDFLDDFSLEGGVRYNWERKRFNFVSSGLAGPQPPSLSETTWTAPTGTVSLSYRFREDVSVYWKYSRGFKAGHYNAIEGADEPARPESIDAFETGLRGRWWEGRLGLGAALFYYKYVDYQVFVVESSPVVPPTLEIINANDAEVYGAELDFRLEPLAGWAPAAFDGLVLSGRFGWLESQFLDFTNTLFKFDLQTRSEYPVLIDYSGNQLINSPRFKLSGALEWTFELGRWGSIIPRYDFAWTDDIFFDPAQGLGYPDIDGELVKPEFALGQPAFWLHNLRLGYRTPEGNIEIAAWVRNLADQRYKSYAFDASTFNGVVLNFVGPPRTIGLDLSISW